MASESWGNNGPIMVLESKRFKMYFEIKVYGTIIVPLIFIMWIHIESEKLWIRYDLDIFVMWLYMFWLCLRMTWKVGSSGVERERVSGLKQGRRPILAKTVDCCLGTVDCFSPILHSAQSGRPISRLTLQRIAWSVDCQVDTVDCFACSWDTASGVDCFEQGTVDWFAQQSTELAPQSTVLPWEGFFQNSFS